MANVYHKEKAARLLSEVETAWDDGSSFAAEFKVECAKAHATLAVAEELRQLRNTVWSRGK